MGRTKVVSQPRKNQPGRPNNAAVLKLNVGHNHDCVTHRTNLPPSSAPVYDEPEIYESGPPTITPRLLKRLTSPSAYDHLPSTSSSPEPVISLSSPPQGRATAVNHDNRGPYFEQSEAAASLDIDSDDEIEELEPEFARTLFAGSHLSQKHIEKPSYIPPQENRKDTRMPSVIEVDSEDGNDEPNVTYIDLVSDSDDDLGIDEEDGILSAQLMAETEASFERPASSTEGNIQLDKGTAVDLTISSERRASTPNYSTHEVNVSDLGRETNGQQDASRQIEFTDPDTPQTSNNGEGPSQVKVSVTKPAHILPVKPIPTGPRRQHKPSSSTALSLDGPSHEIFHPLRLPLIGKAALHEDEQTDHIGAGERDKGFMLDFDHKHMWDDRCCIVLRPLHCTWCSEQRLTEWARKFGKVIHACFKGFVGVIYFSVPSSADAAYESPLLLGQLSVTRAYYLKGVGKRNLQLVAPSTSAPSPPPVELPPDFKTPTPPENLGKKARKAWRKKYRQEHLEKLWADYRERKGRDGASTSANTFSTKHHESRESPVVSQTPPAKRRKVDSVDSLVPSNTRRTSPPVSQHSLPWMNSPLIPFGNDLPYPPWPSATLNGLLPPMPFSSGPFPFTPSPMMMGMSLPIGTPMVVDAPTWSPGSEYVDLTPSQHSPKPKRVKKKAKRPTRTGAYSFKLSTIEPVLPSRPTASTDPKPTGIPDAVASPTVKIRPQLCQYGQNVDPANTASILMAKSCMPDMEIEEPPPSALRPNSLSPSDDIASSVGAESTSQEASINTSRTSIILEVCPDPPQNEVTMQSHRIDTEIPANAELFIKDAIFSMRQTRANTESPSATPTLSSESIIARRLQLERQISQTRQALLKLSTRAVSHDRSEGHVVQEAEVMNADSSRASHEEATSETSVLQSGATPSKPVYMEVPSLPNTSSKEILLQAHIQCTKIFMDCLKNAKTPEDKKEISRLVKQREKEFSLRITQLSMPPPPAAEAFAWPSASVDFIPLSDEDEYN